MFLLAALVAGTWRFWPDEAAPIAGGIDPAVFAATLETNAEGFARVSPGWDFVFPRDQGAHPDYRTEVWDLSGQVVDADGLRYGLRLTFIRIGLAPPTKTRVSMLAANAVMLARFAFAPEDGVGAKISQRASRAAVGLAGADVAPLRVWLEDWSLEQGADGGLLLRAGLDELQLTLALTPRKDAVTEAETQSGSGLFASATGGEGPSFHFFLQPRLSATGTLRLGSGLRSSIGGAAETSRGTANEIAAEPLDRPGVELRDVIGSAWLERAWGAVPSNFAGGRGQLALNRFTLQLDDNTELVCVHLRRKTGGGTPVPNCLAILDDGSSRQFQRRQVRLEPVESGWTRAADGSLYPLSWRLALPDLGLELKVQPLLAEQPMSVGFGEPSWSGAVTLSGRRGDDVVVGSGRMDLNGYAAETEL